MKKKTTRQAKRQTARKTAKKAAAKPRPKYEYYLGLRSLSGGIVPTDYVYTSEVKARSKARELAKKFPNNKVVIRKVKA